MNKNTKKTLRTLLIVITISFILLFVAYVYVRGTILMPAGETANAAQRVGHLISSYIRHNHGNFPTSEADLIDQGFIKKEMIDSHYRYFVRLWSVDSNFPEKEHWSNLWLFSTFKISYGAKVEAIKVVDGKLYDKTTNGQILLLDGKYKKYLKKLHYEPISLNWYKLMLQEKKRVR